MILHSVLKITNPFRLDTGSHFYDTYETKDGYYMAVGAIEPQFYAVLLNKLGLTEDELPHMENFEINKRKMTEIFKTKTQDEWCNIFDGTDACVTPVLTFNNVATHKHNQSQKSFSVSVDNLTVPNPAPRLSRTPGTSCSVQSSNTNPGEHTIEILKEYQYSSEEIQEFLRNDIVEQSQKLSKL